MAELAFVLLRRAVSPDAEAVVASARSLGVELARSPPAGAGAGTDDDDDGGDDDGGDGGGGPGQRVAALTTRSRPLPVASVSTKRTSG
jgi:hypothetical protein